MNQPTEEQIKEFWEWCGIAKNDCDTWANGYPCYDSLDHLFKYAVPKLYPELKIYHIGFLTSQKDSKACILNIEAGAEQHYRSEGYKGLLDKRGFGSTEALALFWAIRSLIVKS